jgi:hypothetical protein
VTSVQAGITTMRGNSPPQTPITAHVNHSGRRIYLHRYESARRRFGDSHDVMTNRKVECQQNSGERSWSS